MFCLLNVSFIWNKPHSCGMGWTYLLGIKTNEKECSRSVPTRNVPLHRQHIGHVVRKHWLLSKKHENPSVHTPSRKELWKPQDKHPVDALDEDEERYEDTNGLEQREKTRHETAKVHPQLLKEIEGFFSLRIRGLWRPGRSFLSGPGHGWIFCQPQRRAEPRGGSEEIFGLSWGIETQPALWMATLRQSNMAGKWTIDIIDRWFSDESLHLWAFSIAMLDYQKV